MFSLQHFAVRQQADHHLSDIGAAVSSLMERSSEKHACDSSIHRTTRVCRSVTEFHMMMRMTAFSDQLLFVIWN